jgi:hypothetical protein
MSDLFTTLEACSTAIAALARARFAEDHPGAAAALGESLEPTFAHAVAEFLDSELDMELVRWNEVVDELLRVDWPSAGALLDVPLGIARAACDQIAEEPDATRWMRAIDNIAARLATPLVERYQAKLDQYVATSAGGEVLPGARVVR